MEAGPEVRAPGSGGAGAARRSLQDSLVGMVSALVVWGVYFVAAYGFLAVGCALGLARVEVLGLDAVRLTLGVMTVLALALIASIAGASVRAGRGGRESQEADTARRRFMSRTTALTAGLALIATAWVGLATVFHPPCV